MSSVSAPEIRKEFVKSKVGLAGIGILAFLIILSAVSAITIPIDTFKQWNNPGSWILYPKTSVPVWINYFVSEKIPEHLILDNPITITKDDTISLTSNQFGVQYYYQLKKFFHCALQLYLSMVMFSIKEVSLIDLA